MNTWTIRADEGGRLAEKFYRDYVTFEWLGLGAMINVSERKEMLKNHIPSYQTKKRDAIANDFSMYLLLRSIVSVGKNTPLTIHKEA